MAKKQFIRHLEFYGFPDQNKYAGFGDIDLSDIREKNKEQDEEIQDLEGEKADKKDLIELSGTVENLIAVQSEINEAFAEAISGMSKDIEELKAIDDEFAEQLSAITDAVDDTINGLEELSGYTAFNLAELRQGFNSYTRYADMEFAHRNNVYTKQEVDDMFASACTSGCATVEWVEEQGFLTEESGDTLYVRIEDLESISGDIESAITDLTDAIVAVDEKVDELSEKVDEKVNTLSGEVFSAITTVQNNLTEYSIYADSRFAHKDDVDSLVDGIENEIQFLSGNVDTNKANISRCADAIRTKATIQALDETRIELQGKIDDLDDRKADKTDVEVLSAAIDDNTVAIATERTERMNEDRVTNNRVDILAERVQSAESTVRSYDVRITNLENGLEQEITDREQQKLDLIGREDDPSTGDTIWAAKNKADEIFNTAIYSAKTYTDAKCDDLYHEFDELSAKTDTELSKFAKKEYVDRRFNDVKTVLRSKIVAGVESAMTYTDDEIAKLDNNIQELDDFVRHPVSGLSVTVNKDSTILNAFTAWDGVGTYSDSGNGIVDVMHREIDDLKPKVNRSINNIEFSNGKLIITRTDGTSFEVDLTT